MMIRSLSPFLLVSVLFAGLQAGCTPADRTETSALDEHLTSEQVAFFDNLRDLCGNAYEGSADFTTPANEMMAGERLVMHVETCSAEEIRIPFHVGADRSRTWIITKTENGLLFKHDHRLPDGSPDEITNYGGYATGEGTAHEQRFPADEDTVALDEQYTTNAWTLTLEPDADRFVYFLERHEQPRFRAVFDLSRTVDPDAAADATPEEPGEGDEAAEEETEDDAPTAD
jgi:hypothetical protein